MAMNPFFSGFIDIYNRFADWDPAVGLSPMVSTNRQSNQVDFFGTGADLSRRASELGDLRTPGYNSMSLGDERNMPYSPLMDNDPLYNPERTNYDDIEERYGFDMRDRMERTDTAFEQTSLQNLFEENARKYVGVSPMNVFPEREPERYNSFTVFDAFVNSRL